MGSKVKSKGKQKKKLTKQEQERKDLRKNSQIAANVIVSKLEDYSFDDLINNIYIKSDNENIKKLTSFYEKQICLAVLDKTKFVNSINKLFSTTNKFIKENDLYKEFFYFYYQNYRTKYISNGGTAFLTEIDKSYNILLEEQFTRFFNNSDRRIIGYSNRENKPITIRNKYTKKSSIDNILLNSLKKKILKVFQTTEREFSIDLNNYSLIEILINYSDLIENSYNRTSFLVDEYNKDMIPEDYSLLFLGLDIPTIGLKKEREKEFYDTFMINRKKLLNNKALIATVDYGEIKRVEIREKFLKDELFLLGRIDLKDGSSFNILYDVLNDLFWSPFLEHIKTYDFSERKSFMIKHDSLKVLVTFIYLVKTNDGDEKSLFDNEFNIKIEEKEFFTYSQEVGGDKQGRKNDRYIKETFFQSPYTRQLPKGQKASIEAIEQAKRFGIKLEEGQTFVKSFEKNIYKLRDHK